MLAIAGYEIVEAINENAKAIVYRAKSTGDGQSVILKWLRSEYPTLAEIAKFKHEFDITRGLAFNGIVKPLRLETHQNSPVLVLEDTQGISLKQFIQKRRRLEIPEILAIGIRLSETLGELHRHRIIHKDIKPDNMIIHEATLDVQITDFSISSRLPRERTRPSSPEHIEGTLTHMSPEQTGRMNRVVDFRTDFYSLGVTLYELLTGKLPFGTDDPVELIHNHIARKPVPPMEEDARIPAALSDIVLKCMSKNAEDRYQSGYGLAHDLRECLNSWERHGTIQRFPYARHDISETFQIPQKLYGRETEAATLSTAFERAAFGTKELVLVSGYSGTGKSTLVHEIHKSLTRRQGFFISGKFDQYKRNIPYFAYIQAFGDLIRQLLTEKEELVLYWKERLQGALGSNGQLLIDLLPELELLIGKQPPVMELPSTESQNRFQAVLLAFLHAIPRPRMQLCLFLDDLQWADSASLQLTKMFLMDHSTSHVLFIGAYRDHEVTASHPFMLLREELTKSDAEMSEMALKPLRTEDVKRLVADTVRLEPGKVTELSQLVHAKTEGNPFFVNQFLTSLYEEQLLVFDPAQGAWTWHIPNIEEKGFTENVIDLMVHKLAKQSSGVCRMLQLVACIGNTFNLHTAAAVSSKSLAETAALLQESVSEGLLITGEQSYTFAALDELLASNWNPQFSFLHDRVQQAAYSLIPDEERMQTHAAIGLLLLASVPSIEQDELLFVVVNHLNESYELLDQAEKDRLAVLNFAAGKRARASAAYETAAFYLRMSDRILHEFGDPWERNHKQTIELHIELAEAEYLCGSFDRAESLLRTAIERAGSPLKRTRLYSLLSVLYTNMTRHTEAVAVGFEALQTFGFRMTRKPTQLTLLLEYLKSRRIMGRRQPKDLLVLPQMTDERVKSILNLIMDASAPAYFINPNLYMYQMLRMVNLSMQHGNTDISAPSYMAFGIVLGSGFGQYSLGYEIGRISLKLNEQLPNPRYACTIQFVFGNFIGHWKHHVKHDLPFLQSAYEAGIESGNFIFAGYAVTYKMQKMEFMGLPLDHILEEIGKWLPFLEKTKNEDTVYLLSMVQAMIRNLQGSTVSETSFDGDQFQETAYVQQTEHAINRVLLQTYYMLKMQSLYSYGHYREALSMAERSYEMLGVVLGLLNQPKHMLYHTLILASLYEEESTLGKTRSRRRMRRFIARMSKWAKECPDNFLAMLRMMQAELARIEGRIQEAGELYDQAIQFAMEQGYTNMAALASELAALFYQRRNMQRMARTYMTDAYYQYVQWGARGKAAQMQRLYPDSVAAATTTLDPKQKDTFTSATLVEHIAGDGSVTSSLSTTNKSLANKELDLAAIIRASQAISGEIVLEELLKKLLDIVMQNAGAEKSLLIAHRDGEWFMEAGSKLHHEGGITLASVSLESCKELSPSIVQYVARTHEAVVLDHASAEGLFIGDDYIALNETKSVFCMPLMNQGHIAGILYLENNLSTGAFTPDRLETLQLLSSQFAISMENARLYSSLEKSRDEISQWNTVLEQRVMERTLELEQAMETLKQAQRQLVQSEKMVALGSLVAGVAHEINTPVGIGVTAASHIEQKTRSLTEQFMDNKMKKTDFEVYLQTMLETAGMIVSNLQRASDLIKSFKQVAVDQSSEMKRSFPIKAYMSELLLSLGMKLKKAKQQVVFECKEDITIHSYPGAISQIGTNLVMNSLIHAYEPEEEGTMTFRFVLEDDWLIMTYSDDGKGMSPSVADKIFDPFFTTNRGGGGTGLGMHIVYNLVTQSLGGTIECESELGKGTTFIIRFPVTTEEPSYDRTII